MKGSTGLRSPPFPPQGGRETGGECKAGWEMIMGRNGLFPQKTDGDGDGYYANQEKLNVDNLRRGENQCKCQYKNRKTKK